MLNFEENLQDELNAAGKVATEKQLERMDTDGSPMTVGSVKMTSKKKKEPKLYETPWGTVRVSRYVYQSAQGGAIYCPLDQTARIVVNSTPRYAKIVGWKYAHMASTELQEDLLRNHGRKVSRSTIRDLADTIGSIAQSKEDVWTYEIPDFSEPVATISLGLDGTTMQYYEGYRIAMCGTIAFFNASGDRLHTIYCAAAPEYGKEIFYKRFKQEIEKVKKSYPSVTYVGVADGAPDNWKFLKPFISQEILDFYHVSEYLVSASEAIFPHEKQRKEWLDNILSQLKHEHGTAKQLCSDLNDAVYNGKSRIIKEKLHKAQVYFKNNWEKMIYPEAVENNWPLGSGITEAACKTIVKQRMCRSGMRWKELGASMLLTLRSLVKSDTYWDNFWDKIDRYGFSVTRNCSA